jgi:hypothetical protein
MVAASTSASALVGADAEVPTNGEHRDTNGVMGPKPSRGVELAVDPTRREGHRRLLRGSPEEAEG